MNEQLEKRMYFFVPYNISPIQQAIQAGHAALEYARKFRDDEEFIDFADNWKTWIILNGGTTNSKRDFDMVSQGTLNQLADQLSLGDGIAGPTKMAWFNEPDLEDALTAVCFICDERVFNYEDYPDFNYFLMEQSIDFSQNFLRDRDITSNAAIKYHNIEELKEIFGAHYMNWREDIMGGEKNVFLRNLLKGKKLA